MPKRRPAVGGKAVPMIDAVWARLAVAELERRGAESGPALAAAGLARPSIEVHGARIPFRAHADLLEAAAQACGDSRFGLTLGCAIDVREAGLVAFVCLNARSFIEALRNLDRYIAVFNDAANVNLVETRDRLEIECSFADLGTHRQAAELGLAIMVNGARVMTGRALSPIEVEFAHPRREDVAAFRRAFGCPVAFGGGTTRVCFDPALAAHPLPAADDRLLRVLVSYCEEILDQRTSASANLRQQVEREILARLQAGEARVDRVAAALGMSVRTLGRRLADEGESFASIRHALRKELALRYLRDEQIGLGEVAFLIGYSDVSAFNHAFKRWTGWQPGAFRAGAAPPRAPASP